MKLSVDVAALPSKPEVLAVVALLKGMLPKLLPIPEPASTLRQTAVASIKPTGMMVMLPS